MTGEHVGKQPHAVGDGLRQERQHLDEGHQGHDVDRNSARHEQLQEVNAVLPEAVDHNREKDEERKRDGNDDVTGDGEGIGNYANHIEYQDEHEKGEYQREELHAFRTSDTSQGCGDKLVGNFRDRLQPSRHQGARARGSEHQKKDNDKPNQHEKGRVRECDLDPADASDRKQVFDLELVDRIHQKGLRRDHAARCRGSAAILLLRTGRIWSHARCPHHVENTRGKSEQQKHDHSQGRSSEPAVDQPADRGTDQDPRDQLGREPKAARERRRIGGRTLSPAAFAGTVAMGTAKLFAKTREPRGERSLVSRLFATIRFARAVGHAFDTRDGSANLRQFYCPPRKRADHTDWVFSSQGSVYWG